MNRKKIIDQYLKETNMTCSEFKRWSKTPCSLKASLNRKPIKLNKKLLCSNTSTWSKKDLRGAKKAISYLKRAKQIKSNNNVEGCEMTKNAIALKNWGFKKS